MTLRTSLTVFRHAPSVANQVHDLMREDRWDDIPESFWLQTDPDYPLSTQGEKEAEQLGWALGQMLPLGSEILAVTSPYVRAVQTLKRALPEQAFLEDLELRERHYGQIEEARKQARRRDLQEYWAELTRAFTDPNARPFTTGQTFYEVIERVFPRLQYWDQYAQQKGVSELVISTHVEIFRAIRTIFHNIDPQDYSRTFPKKIHNCQVDQYTFESSKSGPSKITISTRSIEPPFTLPFPEWQIIQ